MFPKCVSIWSHISSRNFFFNKRTASILDARLPLPPTHENTLVPRNFAKKMLRSMTIPAPTAMMSSRYLAKVKSCLGHPTQSRLSTMFQVTVREGYLRTSGCETSQKLPLGLFLPNIELLIPPLGLHQVPYKPLKAKP